MDKQINQKLYIIFCLYFALRQSYKLSIKHQATLNVKTENNDNLGNWSRTENIQRNFLKTELRCEYLCAREEIQVDLLS